ncbi:MAG: hypothetical protein HFI86_00335 [Bacilli bacterium]|nr:hypothetical protein [Bacilli bacterium]MCI9433708.1 hypothetical protein [Bacilli bacterium]
MNLKKLKIISVFGCFLLAFLTHFLYDWFPNIMFSIFFPVNESIWEHMKMLYSTILLYEFIEYIILKVKNIKINNFLLASFTSAILSIPIYLIMFLPIFYKIGENMIITLTIMLITIIIVQIINYKLINYKELHLNILTIICIIITYIGIGVLTYYPPETDLFFDSKNEKYGVNKYVI